MKDEVKICGYCKKDFVIRGEEQIEALRKGIEILRVYCNACLRRWNMGEIVLDDNVQRRTV